MKNDMKEQLVSLEVAKLLKDKGFDEYCEDAVNYISGNLSKTRFRVNSELPNVYCSMPTQSIAAKWLREKHNLHICIFNNVAGYCYEVAKTDNGTHITYEEALEEGLKETLKLIY